MLNIHPKSHNGGLLHSSGDAYADILISFLKWSTLKKSLSWALDLLNWRVVKRSLGQQTYCSNSLLALKCCCHWNKMFRKNQLVVKRMYELTRESSHEQNFQLFTSRSAVRTRWNGQQAVGFWRGNIILIYKPWIVKLKLHLIKNGLRFQG